jgi:hypothetical protein
VKLVRSWPAVIPQNRSYVVDDIPKLVMSNYSYDCLADLDDDVVLVEWDIAVGREELEAFIVRAGHAPGVPLAAPFRLYHHAGGTAMQEPVWTAWVYRDGRTQAVAPGTPTAHLTSFGLIYLPRYLINGYLAARAQAVDGDQWRFSDISFFGWHHRCVARDVDLDWNARPVHLHYELSDEIRRKVISDESGSCEGRTETAACTS